MLTFPETASPRRVAALGECMIELSVGDDALTARQLGFGGDTLNTAV